MASGAVSPFTLVIGIDQPKDRNLPWMRPSLFVPLAAVVHQHQHGATYTSVSRNDLILFNALGYRGALAAGPSRQQVTDALSAAAGPVSAPMPPQRMGSGGSGGGGMNGSSSFLQQQQDRGNITQMMGYNGMDVRQQHASAPGGLGHGPQQQQQQFQLQQMMQNLSVRPYGNNNNDNNNGNNNGNYNGNYNGNLPPYGSHAYPQQQQQQQQPRQAAFFPEQQQQQAAGGGGGMFMTGTMGGGGGQLNHLPSVYPAMRPAMAQQQMQYAQPPLQQQAPPPPQPLAPQLPQVQVGLSGFNMDPCSGPDAASFMTPLFSLFMGSPLNGGGSSTGAAPQEQQRTPLWWVLSEPGSLSVEGPFRGEQMIVSYLRRSLSDAACVAPSTVPGGGAEALPPDSAAPQPPALSAFQPLGSLLSATHQSIRA